VLCCVDTLLGVHTILGSKTQQVAAWQVMPQHFITADRGAHMAKDRTKSITVPYRYKPLIQSPGLNGNYAKGNTYYQSLCLPSEAQTVLYSEQITTIKKKVSFFFFSKHNRIWLWDKCIPEFEDTLNEERSVPNQGLKMAFALCL
jgi:hypothetical protein